MRKPRVWFDPHWRAWRVHCARATFYNDILFQGVDGLIKAIGAARYVAGKDDKK